MDFRKDIHDIAEWLGCAIAKMITLLNARKTNEPAELIADIGTVVGSYLAVFQSIVPNKELKPFKKNFFSQLSWIAANISWLTILITAFSGNNPFEEAKTLAKDIRTKWGF
jgi:hypothetical protein